METLAIQKEQAAESNKTTTTLSGSQAVLEALIAENVETIFGYPGGAIMPIYDALYDYNDKLKHILVRHEQGGIHAAQGYARASGKVGVVFATSGPGATNLVTGLADAQIDSTPMVCITGQVFAHLLGTDAFQETDVINITTPVTKWNYQVTDATEIPEVMAKAFHIAKTGRPGPVLLISPKTRSYKSLSTTGYNKMDHIRSYRPKPIVRKEYIERGSQADQCSAKTICYLGTGCNIGRSRKRVSDLYRKNWHSCSMDHFG